MNTPYRSLPSRSGLEHREPPARTPGNRLTALAAAGGRVIGHLRQARRRRRAIHELSALSDARLADIGVPRERIPEVVDGLLRREAAARSRPAAEPARATLRAVADCRECA